MAQRTTKIAHRQRPANEATIRRDFVESFARGLTIIQAFGPENRTMTLAQVARQVGLDRAVVRRLLFTLCELGFARVHERRFELTTRVLSLAYSFLSSAGLGASLQPFLDDLARDIGETVSLALLDEAEVVFVARSDVPGRRFAYVVTTGMRLPAFTAASGRILLAHKPPADVKRLLARTRIARFTRHTVMRTADILDLIAQARAQDLSVNYSEIEDDLVSISVPVANRAGLVVAALNASTSTTRASADRIDAEIVPQLRRVARDLASMLP